MTAWRNTSGRYGCWTIGMHWLMLLLIAAVYALMELRGIFPKGSAGYDAMKQWHYMLGMLVFWLALARLALRWSMSKPRIEPPPPAWQERLAGLVQALMYVLMLGLPLAGWLMFSAAGKPVPFFGFELPALIGQNKDLSKQIKEVHETVATIGYGVIGLHAAAALFHHYWMHDNTLLRMLPGRCKS
ncbi:MAG: cytochrome b [Desulfovibrionaceae bacterium]|jgi:cytochrome b561|nr:cytochrome b [Desulfovibrionaceae bacterium]